MTNWKSKTLAQWDAINGLAIRRFGDNPMAEEAALAVVEGLQADDWKRVRAYRGTSSFSTFIRVIALRLFEDFARKRYGRMRPPLWIRTFGGIWQRLFELLCLRRLPVAEAVEVIIQNEAKQYSELESAAYQLLEKIPHCGSYQGLEVAYDEMRETSRSEKSTVNSSFEEKQKRELFKEIFSIVLGAYDNNVRPEVLSKFDFLEITLDAEEKLLLRLCYQEEMSVTGAGKLLGMTRFQTHGKMRRLMKRLRDEFDRVGLTKELKQYL